MLNVGTPSEWGDFEPENDDDYLDDYPESTATESEDAGDIPAFTDDSTNREIYFGEGTTGDEDADTFGLVRETTCGESITDAVILGVDVDLSNGAPEDETLEYGVPALYDHDGDGRYDEGETTEKQDEGLFVESHDDGGNVFVENGSLTIDPDVPDDPPEDDPDPDDDSPEDYEPEGSEDVSTDGLRAAIANWLREWVDPP